MHPLSNGLAIPEAILDKGHVDAGEKVDATPQTAEVELDQGRVQSIAPGVSLSRRILRSSTR